MEQPSRDDLYVEELRDVVLRLSQDKAVTVLWLIHTAAQTIAPLTVTDEDRQLVESVLSAQVELSMEGKEDDEREAN